MIPPYRPPLSFDYALLRVVEDIRTGDGVTVGVVLHSRQAKFIGVHLQTNPRALKRLCPSLDANLVQRYLDATQAVALGGVDAGPIGLHTPSERFHWLTATRSTVIQASPVQTGQAADPAQALEAIVAEIAQT